MYVFIFTVEIVCVVYHNGLRITETYLREA